AIILTGRSAIAGRNGPRITRIRRISTDRIRENPSNPCHPWAILLSRMRSGSLSYNESSHAPPPFRSPDPPALLPAARPGPRLQHPRLPLRPRTLARRARRGPLPPPRLPRRPAHPRTRGRISNATQSQSRPVTAGEFRRRGGGRVGGEGRRRPRPLGGGGKNPPAPGRPPPPPPRRPAPPPPRPPPPPAKPPPPRRPPP